MRLKLKLTLLIVSLLVMGSILMGCTSSNNDNSLMVPSELLITEKTLPDNFYELADQGVLVSKVTNQDQFNQQWDYYRLTEHPTEIDWDNKVAIFLGIFESGSCPYEFKFTELNEEKTDLIIYLHVDSKGACTDDATPRTIVIAVDADQVSDINFVEVYNYYGTSPRVEFFETKL